MRASTRSPGRTFADGFAADPFTRTWPPSHNRVASGRVFTRRTAHSQRSIRVSSIARGSVTRSRIARAEKASRRSLPPAAARDRGRRRSVPNHGMASDTGSPSRWTARALPVATPRPSMITLTSSVQPKGSTTSGFGLPSRSLQAWLARTSLTWRRLRQCARMSPEDWRSGNPPRPTALGATRGRSSPERDRSTRPRPGRAAPT
jgi:hypothetical protein